jgi:hypothetical protein
MAEEAATFVWVESTLQEAIESQVLNKACKIGRNVNVINLNK